MLNTVICRDGVCRYKKESFIGECSDCDIVEKVEMDILKEIFGDDYSVG